MWGRVLVGIVAFFGDFGWGRAFRYGGVGFSVVELVWTGFFVGKVLGVR